MSDDAMRDDIRDPELPGRLLLTERDALIPLLRDTPDDAFTLRTACPDWNVRQVLAHCGAALIRIVEGRLERGVFSPESNAADVAERDNWPLGRVLDELERGFTEAGPVIAARSDGLLDLVALGEWVHAGDVREAFGVPGAYAGESADAALALLAVAGRRRKTPLLHVFLPDRSAPLAIGTARDGRPAARLTTDVPTLIRLFADRPLVGARYELTGAERTELHTFG